MVILRRLGLVTCVCVYKCIPYTCVKFAAAQVGSVRSHIISSGETSRGASVWCWCVFKCMNVFHTYVSNLLLLRWSFLAATICETSCALSMCLCVTDTDTDTRTHIDTDRHTDIDAHIHIHLCWMKCMRTRVCCMPFIYAADAQEIFG